MTLLLAPYAPHLAEEVWEKLGHNSTLAYNAWPKFENSLVTEDTVTLSIQINGKLRGTLIVDKAAGKDDIIAQARKTDGVEKHLEGKEIVKEIFVPGKIVSFVVK
jgi:leucyl-tRNA synthetase